MNEQPDIPKHKWERIQEELDKANRELIEVKAQLEFAMEAWRQRGNDLQREQDSLQKVLADFRIVKDERDQWREMACMAIDRLKSAMGHISGEHPHWRNGAEILRRFTAMEKGQP
jgi:hypothetical protein